MAEAVMVAGAGLQAYGKIEQARQQAKAQRANQRMFELQREQIERATRRQADIFKTESEMFIGDQVSSYAKAGVDISGSALLQIAGTKADQGRELAAIQDAGEMKSQLAGIKADQARKSAERLTSNSFRGLIIAQSALGAAGGIMNAQSPSPSNLDSTQLLMA